MSGRASNAAGAGCIMLFALPFIGAGVFLALESQRAAEWADAAATWPRSEARILETALVEEYSSDGDSVKYLATARYTYVWEGREYTGTRVTPYDEAGTGYLFQHRLHDELRAHQEAGTLAPVYVNPENPGEAVLFLEIDEDEQFMLMLMGAIFGGAGALVFVAGAFGVVRAVRRKTIAAPDDAPWMSRPEWREREIVCSKRNAMYGLWLFGFLWGIPSFAGTYFVWTDADAAGDPVRFIVLLFPLVGLAVLAGAVYMTMQHLKYGVSRFRMASMPGVIGGALSGIIQVDRHIEPEDGFHLSLRCIRRYTTGSGKNRSTREDTVWEEKRTMRRELLDTDRTRTVIPVLFGIPYAAEQTTAMGGGNGILWRLLAHARTPGVDYAAQFDVPVFRTPESSPNFQLDESAIEDYADQEAPERQVAASGIQVSEAPGNRLRIHVPPFRNPGFGGVMIVIGGIFGGAGLVMYPAGAPLLMALIFVPVGGLLLGYGVLTLLRSTEVFVDFDGIEIRERVLGKERLTRVRKDEIASIDLEDDGTYNNTTLHRIVLTCNGGKRVYLARHLEDRRVGDQIIGRIMAHL